MHQDQAATIAAYDAYATAYADGTAARAAAQADQADQGAGQADVVHDLDDYAARLAPGSRVLEIGSGPGLDARRLEDRGLVVRRTDVTPAFVELMRADGHQADRLDPLTDDLLEPSGEPYAGVWADACLLHVRREDLPVVLARLRAATRDGGILYVSLKEGDGERWSTHGHVAAPRHFTYWREGPLRGVLADAGWSVQSLRRGTGLRDDHWLAVVGRAGGVEP